MAPGDPFGALVVDDLEDVRLLLTVYIRNENRGLFVKGEASDGAEAVRLARELDPDVIVMDHMMPNMSGLEAARQIRAERPEQRMVLCTAYLSSAIQEEADGMGVTCVPKERASEIPRLLVAMRDAC